MKNKLYLSLIIIVFSISSCFAFETRTLPSGQTVIVEQIKNNPIVIVDTWVKTGSINENDLNNGVSHFLEHLLFKGSKKYPTGEFDKILENKGGIVNAATSKDFTHFYIQIPSKDFDTAIDLHSDMLLHPTIPNDELTKERLVVIEEIAKDENNPNKIVYENLINNLYKTHPYKRKVIGTKDIIANISREAIFDYYNKYYIPQNMTTIIIGDIEPEYAFKKVEEKFNVKQKKLKKAFNPKEQHINKQITNIAKEPVNSGYMIIGYHVPEAKHEDNYALDVLATILGDGKSSVLYKNIKENKQLAFNIYASNSSYKDSSIFMVNANFIPENTDALKQEIFKEINDIITNGVSQTQLDIAKKFIETDIKYGRESISNIASQIGYTTTITDTTSYYKTYLDKINKITTKDIQNVAKKYLSENKSIVSIVLPEDYTPVTKQETKEHSSSLMEETNRIKKYLLDNNSTLLINNNKYNDIIAISIYAKGGRFIEKIPTTANLVASGLLKGTKKYSAQELANIMEENGIKITPSVSGDSFNIDIITTKSQLYKTFEILDEIVNNATFNEQDIDKIKKDKLNSIKQSEDIPMNIAIENLREQIYGKSPYSIANKQFLDNFSKITRKDILEYYNNIFSSQNIIISINGNIENTDVQNELSTIFKQKFGTFSYNDKLIPNIQNPKKIVKYKKDLGTAWFFIGWQTCGVQNIKDYATLTVIDSLLGSGMSSRLFVNLREKNGLAYQIGSSYAPRMLKGSFLIYIGTNPKTLNKSQELIMKEINRLKCETVNDAELQNAKDKVIGRYLMSQETNLDKASQLGWFEVTQRGLNFGEKYSTIINSVTADDIIKVANKYFTNNNIISIIKEEE